MGRSYTVIGVDPNSRKLAAVAQRPDGQLHAFCTEVSKDQAVDRGYTIGFLFNGFLDWLRDLEPGAFYMFVEQPLMGRNVHAMRTITQGESAALLAAHEQGASGIYEVNVQTWKKDIVGQGNASKSIVKSYLEEHHNDLAVLANNDQDLFDAGAILLYGVEVIERGTTFAA